LQKAVSHANAAGGMGTRNRRADNAAFGASPQGFGPGDPLRTAQIGQVTGQERPKTPLVWPYRDHGPRPRPGSHANVRHTAKVTQYWSHGVLAT